VTTEDWAQAPSKAPPKMTADSRVMFRADPAEPKDTRRRPALATTHKTPALMEDMLHPQLVPPTPHPADPKGGLQTGRNRGRMGSVERDSRGVL